MLIAVLRNKFIVLFIIIFGTLSFQIEDRYQTDRANISSLTVPLTLDTDIWPWFSMPGELWSWPTQRNKRTDGRNRFYYLSRSVTSSCGICQLVITWRVRAECRRSVSFSSRDEAHLEHAFPRRVFSRQLLCIIIGLRRHVCHSQTSQHWMMWMLCCFSIKFYPGTGLSFLGPTRVHSRHRFSQVCRAYGRGQQTDIQTDHTTRVAIVSISCGAA